MPFNDPAKQKFEERFDTIANFLDNLKGQFYAEEMYFFNKGKSNTDDVLSKIALDYKVGPTLGYIHDNSNTWYNLDEYNSINKNALKRLIIEFINQYGKPQLLDEKNNIYMAKARLATFICISRNCDMNFTKNDLVSIAGADCISVLDVPPIKNVLKDKKVSKLMNNETIYHKTQTQPVYNTIPEVPLIYDNFVSLTSGFQNGFLKHGIELNEFLHQLATKGKVKSLGEYGDFGNLDQFNNNKQTLKAFFIEIISRDADTMKSNYDESDIAKVKLATFICLARNFNIDFTRSELLELSIVNGSYHTELTDKYPINEILMSQEVKKLIVNEPNYADISQTQNQYAQNITYNQFIDNGNYQQFQKQGQFQSQQIQNQTKTLDSSLKFKDFNDLLSHLKNGFTNKIYGNEKYSERGQDGIDKFLSDLAINLKVKELGVFGKSGDLSKLNNGDKKDLKEKLMYAIIDYGFAESNKGAHELHFKNRAKISAFICMARNFGIKFTKNDLATIVNGHEDFKKDVVDSVQVKEILENPEVKELIEDDSTLDYGHEPTQPEEKSLEDLVYNKEINLEGNNIDDTFKNLIDDANTGFKDRGVTKDNFNSFIYELATQGQINKSTLENTTKKDIITKLKDAGEIGQVYDESGDSFNNKVKLATFLCVCRNFNIEFDRSDLNNLFDNDDFYDRYPANEMLKNTEISKLMNDKNEISQKTNYQVYNSDELKNSNNENKADLENANSGEKQKLAVALAEYFSFTNNQDKVNAIKDLSLKDREKIVNFDRFMNDKLENAPEEAKKIVLEFLDFYDYLSSNDNDLKVELKQLKGKINIIKEPSKVKRFLASIKDFLWKPFAWIFVRSNKNPPSIVFIKKDKDTAKNMIKNLNVKLDKMIENEKSKESKSKLKENNSEKGDF